MIKTADQYSCVYFLFSNMESIAYSIRFLFHEFFCFLFEGKDDPGGGVVFLLVYMNVCLLHFFRFVLWLKMKCSKWSGLVKERVSIIFICLNLITSFSFLISLFFFYLIGTT